MLSQRLREPPRRGAYDYLVTTPVGPDPAIPSPPSPPGGPRGEGPSPQVHIHIGIVQPPPPRRESTGAAACWLILLVLVLVGLLFGCTAQAAQSQHPTDRETWTCESYEQSGHRYEICRSSTGEIRTCDTYEAAGIQMTECY